MTVSTRWPPGMPTVMNPALAPDPHQELAIVSSSSTCSRLGPLQARDNVPLFPQDLNPQFTAISVKTLINVIFINQKIDLLSESAWATM